MGPYFTCSESVDGDFILAWLLETLKLFQMHGLGTSLLICDECLANLATIKTTHGYSGAYSILSDTTGDIYKFKPWMVNPYCPPALIYWMICLLTRYIQQVPSLLFTNNICLFSVIVLCCLKT